MPKKILAFGASNSRHSINKAFATFAAQQIADAELNIIDLNNFDMPLYGIDRQKTEGIPPQAYQFKEAIAEADGIIISFAEHNGSYTVAFKNVFDWSTRVLKQIWQNKPMLLLATSEGSRGALSVLETATQKISHMNDNTIVSFSLPFYGEKFTPEEGFKDEELKQAFEKQLKAFSDALHS